MTYCFCITIVYSNRISYNQLRLYGSLLSKKIANQIKYWYRKYVPEIIRKIIRKSVPFWVQLRYFNIQTKNFDFDIQGHGEAKKLLEICSELNISNGYYVDIGASDGWSSSSTFSFAKSKNFSGLSVELDDKKFKKCNIYIRIFIMHIYQKQK